MPLPDSSVQVNLGKASATYQMADLQTRDYHDFVNDALHGPFVPAVASWKMQFAGTGKRTEVRDSVNGFVADLIPCEATIEWSTTEAGVEYIGHPSACDYAAIGRERNGVFFPGSPA